MNGIKKSGHSYAKIKMNFTLNFTVYTKVNVSSVNEIIHLNVKYKTINVLEENRHETLFNLESNKECLDMTPKAQSIKQK